MVYNEQDIEDYVVDCPQCGTENTISNNSCTNCGYDIRTHFCPECNTLNYHNENICQYCGYDLRKFNDITIDENHYTPPENESFNQKLVKTSRKKIYSVTLIVLILYIYNLTRINIAYEDPLRNINLIQNYSPLHNIFLTFAVLIFCGYYEFLKFIQKLKEKENK